MASDIMPVSPLVYAPVTGTVEKGAVDADAPVFAPIPVNVPIGSPDAGLGNG